ncbi:MAG TPA: agmatine deiminase family protein [Planctomycetaceae bacterium]|nr:agmatine deiminase family protein [Planctomycetaceae bacterium]
MPQHEAQSTKHKAQSTPRELGYRMPAEWEPHQATWLSWPHKEASWPGKLHLILPVYARMVAALARSEPVHINVNDFEMQRSARRLLDAAGADGEIHFRLFPTNDAWCRDHGAIFVVQGVAGAERSGAPAVAATAPGASQSLTPSHPAALAATDWGFNAWGNKYPPFDLDDQIPRRMAEFLNVPRFDGGMILEGGSIDVNGRGLLLTTEACLLNPNRNPHLGRDQIEQRLRDFLGVSRVLWLGEGIVGDDTDGHVDDLARFVAPNVIVAAIEDDPADANYEPLQQNWQRLTALAETTTPRLEIIPLPMPPAVVYEAQRLPASYANFYIGNRVILLPGFDPERDRQAAGVLRPFFPDREIVTIGCTDLVWGLGAFHCLTQQVPAVPLTPGA